MLRRGIFSGKVWITLGVSLMIMLGNPMLSMAQYDDPDLPCDGADVYGECPLDTGSVVLLLAGLLLGVYFIYKNQHRLTGKKSS